MRSPRVRLAGNRTVPVREGAVTRSRRARTVPTDGGSARESPGPGRASSALPLLPRLVADHEVAPRSYCGLPCEACSAVGLCCFCSTFLDIVDRAGYLVAFVAYCGRRSPTPELNVPSKCVSNRTILGALWGHSQRGTRSTESLSSASRPLPIRASRSGAAPRRRFGYVNPFVDRSEGAEAPRAVGEIGRCFRAPLS